jgi:hypothetical protein
VSNKVLLGAGCYDTEHASIGVDFLDAKGRVSRPAEVAELAELAEILD